MSLIKYYSRELAGIFCTNQLFDKTDLISLFKDFIFIDNILDHLIRKTRTLDDQGLQCIDLLYCFLYAEAATRGVIEKDVLKNFIKFTENHLRWSLFFNKLAALRPTILLKRGSDTGVFL